jgi:glycosyltransferase involved in cell wall biosynthesis
MGEALNIPLVSILMPARNAAATLSEALDSLLNQTLEDFEIVLVDDGSTDSTAKIALSYQDKRIHVIRQRPAGIAPALNKGLSYCHGVFVARADADDISEPYRLKIQTDALQANPDLAGVSSNLRLFGAKKGQWEYPHDSEEIKASMIFNSSLAHPAILLRKSFLKKGYPLNYPHAEDYALWSRLILSGACFSSIPKALVCYRVHPDQVTKLKNPQHLRSADKVRRNWLSELGISPSHEEMDLHCGRGQGDIFLDKIEVWLLRLEEANRSKRLFDLRAFSNVLGERWLSLCVANRHLGFKAFKRYWAAPWAGKGTNRPISRYLSAAWNFIWE